MTLSLLHYLHMEIIIQELYMRGFLSSVARKHDQRTPWAPDVT